MQHETCAMLNICRACETHTRRTPKDATKPTRDPQTTEDLSKAPTPSAARYVSAPPRVQSGRETFTRQTGPIKTSAGHQTWRRRTETSVPKTDTARQGIPEIARSRPPPPKPGFGFSSSCSLPNCSSSNSLPSSFLGGDSPRGMAAGCTASRKLK